MVEDDGFYEGVRCEMVQDLCIDMTDVRYFSIDNNNCLLAQHRVRGHRDNVDVNQYDRVSERAIRGQDDDGG